jgi:hypothetical protein
MLHFSREYPLIYEKTPVVTVAADAAADAAPDG